jgi:hypothetical protein
MTASVGMHPNAITIPDVITGTEQQPRLYGKSASERFYDLEKQAMDEFISSGNKAPMAQLGRAALRYTPEDPVTDGHISDEAAENAIGSAQASIAKFDRDGDHALSRQEVADIFMQPYLEKINQLQRALRINGPMIPKAEKETIQTDIAKLKNDGDKVVNRNAGNLFQSVDVRDANGQSDDKLTADELAAKVLFDDAALQMFQNNQTAFKDHISENKAMFPWDSFKDLQNSVMAIAQRPHEHPLAQDGLLTPAEGDVSHLLIKVPIPTNKIISAIHQQAGLKDRLQAQELTNSHM